MKLDKALLFSFGTLQKSEIQKELFGREISGTIDSISGWKVLNNLEIEGEKYPFLAKQKNGVVFGQIFELSVEQISILDKYETESYYRDKVKTDGGVLVNVYLRKKSKKKLEELTEKDKRRLHIFDVDKKDKKCCSSPKPRDYVTEMFENYTLCDNCGKEIL